MPEQQSLNDKAWEILFSQRNIMLDVEKEGIHLISAKEINTKREARLMTKFDHLINLPKIFKDNGLSILPNSRNSYVIGRFDCYTKLQDFPDEEIIYRTLPDWMQSLDATNLYSESSALLCAQHTGLIAEVLDEEKDNVALTVFGRMSTGIFDFTIRRDNSLKGTQSNLPLHVDRAQCEVDGGFEGVNSFALVEVKNLDIDDFHTRQLYYPYRLWANKLSKPVVPIFLTYSNEVFSFYVYEFANPDDYNSLQLIKKKRYQIVPNEIEISDIRRLLVQTSVAPEPEGVPFPQADQFDRVVDLLTNLAAMNGTQTQDEVTINYSFDLRQTQYYTNAGRYLGFVERFKDDERGVYYNLNASGIQLMKKTPRARNLALVEAMLSRRVFRTAVEHYLKNAECPPNDVIVSLISAAGLKIGGTTPPRRAQTVRGWIKWIMNLTTEG